VEWTPARIRLLRAAGLSLSQDEFATALGFTKRTVGNAERGVHPPSLALRRALDQAWEKAPDAQRDRFLAVQATAQTPIQVIPMDVSADSAQGMVATTACAGATTMVAVESLAVQREVAMAAAESARFGQFAEQSNVGPHTLEQFRADLARIVTSYPNRPIYPLFVELCALRNRAFELLEGRQHPEQGRELYLVAACCAGFSPTLLSTWAGYRPPKHRLVRRSCALS
jgi:DNA-binding XRE family transcriptional regulator